MSQSRLSLRKDGKVIHVRPAFLSSLVSKGIVAIQHKRKAQEFQMGCQARLERRFIGDFVFIHLFQSLVSFW